MFKLDQHSNIVLRKSVFGHFLQNSDIVCAYHALTMESIYFDSMLLPVVLKVLGKTIGEILQELNDNMHQELIDLIVKICKANILVPEEYDEMRYLQKIRDLSGMQPSIRVLVLHLSDHCNLRCGYCFIEGCINEKYVRQNMSNEIAEKAIEHFCNLQQGKKHPKNPSIVFYGGEPLLNWNTMVYALKYADAYCSKIGLARLDKVLITNGTLVTPQIAKTLNEYNVMVSVSIDGPSDIHDLNRWDADGKSVYSDVISGFDELVLAGIRPTVSCVISKGSLDHGERIIRWLLDDLKVKALGFNHVSIVPNVNEFDLEYESRFADVIIEVQQIIQRDYPDVYERRMNHKINSFLDRKILRADCTGCGEQMSVSPDGFIGICQGYMGSRKTFTEHVSNATFDPIRNATFVEWSTRSPLNMPQCYNCVALATCGGGCPRNADMLHGSIWKEDTPFCQFAKKAQEWMIWKLYEKRS